MFMMMSRRFDCNEVTTYVDEDYHILAVRANFL